MVFAGSVGLHHVVTDLKQVKLASEPVNDMPAVEIHGLAETDAIELAARLLQDEQVQFAKAESELIHERIVQGTDCVPFHIEAVCSRLVEIDREISPADVDETVRQQLHGDHDPWEMEHFRERLHIYYSGSVTDTEGRDIPNAAIARAILDHLCLATEPQSIDQIWAAMTAQFALAERQRIIELLRSLALDHYLMSVSDKRYTFRFELIARWWKTAQGLLA